MEAQNSYAQVQDGGIYSVEDLHDPSQQFLVEYSNQGMLFHVCESVGLHAPSWSLRETKQVEGSLFYQYSLSLDCDNSGKRVVKTGDFHNTDDEARESVALLMLQAVCNKHGKTIKYYNYHKVKKMEDLVRLKDEQTMMVQAENTLLKLEINALKTPENEQWHLIKQLERMRRMP